MGEKTGFLVVMILFFLGFVPFLFYLYTQQIQTNKLMTISNEVNQLLVAEGDITPKVIEMVNNLDEKGVKITFYDEDGNPITARSEIGEKIDILFEYGNYETMNSVYLTKRIE